MARAVLLAALLRWGDSPRTVQTVLSAYTAAALRLAQQQQAPPLEPQGAEARGDHPADEEREEDQQRGRDAGRGKQRQRRQPAAALVLEESLAAAEQAVGSLLDLQAAMRVLAAACDVLQPATQLPLPATGQARRERDSAERGSGGSSSRAALRAYWFAEDKGLRQVTMADGLCRSSAAVGDDPQGLAAAIAAAVERSAAALDTSGGVGCSDSSSFPCRAAAAALDLACACVVQLRWAAMCRLLAGAADTGCEACHPGPEKAASPASTKELPAPAAPAQAAAAVARELGQVITSRPALLISGAPEALAAACWAEPRLAEACFAALASPACASLATESADAADRLRRLLTLLQELGCLPVD